MALKNSEFLLFFNRSYTIIRNDGFKAYLDQVKEKFKKREFKIITNSVPPQLKKEKTTSIRSKTNTNNNDKLSILGIPKDLKGKTVLDIGCNEGFFSFECEKRGAKVIGIESNPVFYLNVLKKKNTLSSFVNFLKMYEDDIQHLNYKFDLVFFSTLHSVQNQENILTTIFQKLNNNGKLILFAKLIEKNQNIFHIEKKIRNNGDVHQFPNKFTIQRLLEKAGFRNISFSDKSIIIPGLTPSSLIIAYKNEFDSRQVDKNGKLKRKSYQTFSESEKGGSNSILKLSILGIPKDLKGKTVLDIGCNEGFFSFECEKRGAKVIGIEKNEYWYNTALKRKKQRSSSVNFLHMSWDNIEKLETKFDLVLFLASFHYVLNNHVELLKKIYERMNENGLLILDIGLSQKNNGFYYIENQKRARTGIECAYPNQFTINQMLQKAGFKNISYFGESNIMKDFTPRYIIHVKK